MGILKGLAALFSLLQGLFGMWRDKKVGDAAVEKVRDKEEIAQLQLNLEVKDAQAKSDDSKSAVLDRLRKSKP